MERPDGLLAAGRPTRSDHSPIYDKLNPAVGRLALLAESAESADMPTPNLAIIADPRGGQHAVEVRSATTDIFAGRLHLEWDASVPVTPFEQLPYFID